MGNSYDIMNRAKTGKIFHPFPKKFVLTITADLETGQTSMVSNISIPFASIISMLLHSADTMAQQWAQHDGMIVGKGNGGVKLTDTEKEAASDGEKTDKNDNN